MSAVCLLRRSTSAYFDAGRHMITYLYGGEANDALPALTTIHEKVHKDLAESTILGHLEAAASQAGSGPIGTAEARQELADLAMTIVSSSTEVHEATATYVPLVRLPSLGGSPDEAERQLDGIYREGVDRLAAVLGPPASPRFGETYALLSVVHAIARVAVAPAFLLAGPRESLSPRGLALQLLADSPDARFSRILDALRGEATLAALFAAARETAMRWWKVEEVALTEERFLGTGLPDSPFWQYFIESIEAVQERICALLPEMGPYANAKMRVKATRRWFGWMSNLVDPGGRPRFQIDERPLGESASNVQVARSDRTFEETFAAELPDGASPLSALPPFLERIRDAVRATGVPAVLHVRVLHPGFAAHRGGAGLRAAITAVAYGREAQTLAAEPLVVGLAGDEEGSMLLSLITSMYPPVTWHVLLDRDSLDQARFLTQPQKRPGLLFLHADAAGGPLLEQQARFLAGSQVRIRLSIGEVYKGHLNPLVLHQPDLDWRFALLWPASDAIPLGVRIKADFPEAVQLGRGFGRASDDGEADEPLAHLGLAFIYQRLWHAR